MDILERAVRHVDLIENALAHLQPDERIMVCALYLGRETEKAGHVAALGLEDVLAVVELSHTASRVATIDLRGEPGDVKIYKQR